MTLEDATTGQLVEALMDRNDVVVVLLLDDGDDHEAFRMMHNTGPTVALGAISRAKLTVERQIPFPQEMPEPDDRDCEEDEG